MESWGVALVVLVAVLVGAAIPVLIQLRATLRTMEETLQRSGARLDAWARRWDRRSPRRSAPSARIARWRRRRRCGPPRPSRDQDDPSQKGRPCHEGEGARVALFAPRSRTETRRLVTGAVDGTKEVASRVPRAIREASSAAQAAFAAALTESAGGDEVG